jgi:protein SCO1/2
MSAAQPHAEAADLPIAPARKLPFGTILLVVPAFLLLLIALAVLGTEWFTDRTRLVGTDIKNAPAPNFTLINQDGRQVSLSDYKGKPVTLTFLYTRCPDVCPLIASQLAVALDRLGPDAGKVAMVAVSVDPEHDDRLAVQRFNEEHKLAGRFDYLIGSPAQLQRVWQAYYVASQPIPTVGPALGGVLHSSPLFVIDKQGRERVLLDEQFDPQDLVHDLQVLLGE